MPEPTKPGVQATPDVPGYRFPPLLPGEHVLITHTAHADCPQYIILPSTDEGPFDFRAMGLRMTNYALSLVFFDGRFPSIFIPVLAFETLETFKLSQYPALAANILRNRDSSAAALTEGVYIASKTGFSLRFTWCNASRFVDLYYRILPRSLTDTFAFKYAAELRTSLAGDQSLTSMTASATAEYGAEPSSPTAASPDDSNVPPIFPSAASDAPCAAYWSAGVPLVLTRPPERTHAARLVQDLLTSGTVAVDPDAEAASPSRRPPTSGVASPAASPGPAGAVCSWQPYAGVPAAVAVPDGWTIYCPRAELVRQLRRMTPSERSAWRLSRFNVDCKVGTYPSHIVVPAGSSDGDLERSALYRSRGRLPAITWVGRGGSALARASQPLRGLLGGKANARHDEALLLAIAWAGLVDAHVAGDAAAAADPSRGGASVATPQAAPRAADFGARGGGVSAATAAALPDVLTAFEAGGGVEVEVEVIEVQDHSDGDAPLVSPPRALGDTAGSWTPVRSPPGAAPAPAARSNPFDAAKPRTAEPPALFGGPTGLSRSSATTAAAVAALPPGRSAASVDIVVVDARSQLVANANRSKGGGHEGSYRNTVCLFLDIVNIHAVSDAWAKVTRAALSTCNDGSSCTRRPQVNLREVPKEVVPNEGSTVSFPPIPNGSYHDQWLRSGWPILAQRLLWGGLKVADMLMDGRRVLVHCTDGWDRTAQLCGTAQLLLDPYFRTVEGFAVLVEKDWFSFGHKISERSGHKLPCSQTEVARVNDAARGAAPTTSPLVAGLAGLGLDGAAGALALNSASGSLVVNVGERTQVSPIFLQWIDSVYQMMRQVPDAFEFTAEYLLCVVDAIYCGRYGNSLVDTDNARVRAGLPKQTVSLWTELFAAVAEERAHCEASPDYLLPHRRLLNPQYLAPAAGGPVVIRITPNSAHLAPWDDLILRLWAELPPTPACHPNAGAAGDRVGRQAWPSASADLVGIYDTVLTAPSALGLGSVALQQVRCVPRPAHLQVVALGGMAPHEDEYLLVPTTHRRSDTLAARRRIETTSIGTPSPYALPIGIQHLVFRALPLARGALAAATAAIPPLCPTPQRLKGFQYVPPHTAPHPPADPEWGPGAEDDDVASPLSAGSPPRRGALGPALAAAATAAAGGVPPALEVLPGAEGAIHASTPAPYSARFAFGGAQHALGVTSVEDPDQLRGNTGASDGAVVAGVSSASAAARATRCSRCRDAFSFFKRRHQCRLCGGQFCDGCSSGKIRSTAFPEGARVCDLCAGRVNPADLLSA